ncbi:MAG TPA: serine hydrolase domain-containing protein [Longimicrobiales bacterium]|nr:serine hydrolase domain-containing protein [Longimicrobiales bacterium]
MLNLLLLTATLGAGLREAPAELAGFNAARLARVDSTIEAAIRDGASPGVALAIGRRGEMVRLRGYGRLTYAANAPAVTDSTLFDLASLTKVIGTTTAVMKLVDEARIHLDIPIHQYLAVWPSTGEASGITLRHLLNHTSGLPAGMNLWSVRGREAKISRIAQLRLVAPPGMQTVYSDVGMVVVGAIIESVTGERLDDYLEREVFAPMGMKETMFNPAERMVENEPILVPTYDASIFFAPFNLIALWNAGTEKKFIEEAQVAPTENGLRGRVHDPIANELDGVAGNAGLFSSARDLAVFAEAMIEAAAADRDAPFARAATVDEFVNRGQNKRGLGWESPSGRSSAGDYFSASSFGHTGYTGTSIWIDPVHDLYVILLTNRIYPTAVNQKHIALRRAVHDEVELAISDQDVALRD